MDRPLNLYGVGTYLPPGKKVRELVRAAGGDAAAFDGWENVGHAGADDHPSLMATQALKRALTEANVPPDQLKLVISGGVSRDYQPSWSVATEVLRLLEIPSTCLGFDMTLGCLGTITGLEIAYGWLAHNGGGWAAIVNAERWSHTIDYSDAKAQGLWGHADGASAVVVGMDVSGKSLATYCGACYSSQADFNGYILIKYGGTRHPVAPPGESPFVRKLADKEKHEVYQTYLLGYMRAVQGLKERFSVEFTRILCNQISPTFIYAIGGVAGLSQDQVCVTGDKTGHVGSADILIGVRKLLDEKSFAGNILMAASTPYAFGAGLLKA